MKITKHEFKSSVLIWIFILPLLSFSQDLKTISGTITSQEDNMPLPGVNILVENTNYATVSDFDGNFTLEVPENGATLKVSYIGFKTKTIDVDSQDNFNLVLEPDVASLSEVVVVGYGKQKKSDIVGSISSVSQKKLENNASPNIFQALQGAAPGLNIQRSSGQPGSSGSIQVRGLNSISANNSPLIIVDGIPFSGNINEINPNDISSVEVLKDASASAIYGSRAASGVILINTKRGTDGKTVIEFNTSVAVQEEAVEYQVMNTNEFFKFRKEAYRTEGIITANVSDDEAAPIILESNELKSWERRESIDWMNEMLNNAPVIYNNQISINSGNEKIRNYFSLSYVKEEGLQKKTGFKRYTLKNNLELLSIAPWLKVGNNLLFSYNNYNRMVWGINNQPAFYRLSPFARIYEDDGSFTRFPQANDELLVNPVAENQLSSRANDFTNFFNNIYFEVTPEFAEGLSYRLNFGSTLRYTKEAIYWPRGTWLGDINNGLADVNVSRLWEYTLENILSYSKSFGDHSFDFTGLYSRQSSDFERTTSGASGFVTDDLLWYDLNAGETPLLPGSGSNPKNEWDLVSYMARLNYNYMSKYYITATVRKDGYSGFASNTKYGTFPSAALAWRISNEQFMQEIDWIQDLKFRVSYGTVGNQAVGTYRSLARLGNAQYVFGETVVGGVRVNSLRNDNLGWEKATTLNIGADFSLVNGRISGALDFYRTQTEDLLLNREIPKITGQNDILFNIGKLKNVGFELALNTIPVRTQDFIWRLGLNFSTNKNEIEDLYGDQKDDVQNQWFIGEPLNVIYDFQFDGIWQSGQEDEIAASATPERQPGDVKIKDQNDDGVIDANDRVIVGVQQPDWLGGLSSTFSYKDLSLDVFVQTVQGIDRRFREEGVSARFIKAPYDYWTPENPSNTWFRPRINAGPTPLGSIDVYDASFVRLKDITLSYNLPSSLMKKTGLDKTKIYINLHDYFTFTEFPYVDPEAGAYAEISIPKYILLGLNVSF
ncbi:MAG TPA: TonB-dependent receptor [Leeuwenhoekiella sp.]|nr:TonB-dependent receptor [Leeuwenhoekiella sp.]